MLPEGFGSILHTPMAGTRFGTWSQLLYFLRVVFCNLKFQNAIRHYCKSDLDSVRCFSPFESAIQEVEPHKKDRPV